MNEELQQVIEAIIANSYRFGLVQGSGREFFVNGEMLNLADLEAERQELSEKYARLTGRSEE